MFSVASMLKPSREAAVDHLEELAARIAGGEVVAPEEVIATLERLRESESDLEAAVKRQTAVAGLRRQIAEAGRWQKRLDEIEAEYDAAEREYVKARDAYNALQRKHHDEHMTCRHRLDAIEHAKRALVAEENLPPTQAARLRAARQACSGAADLRDAAAHELRVRQGRLRQAEEELPQAEETARLHPSVDGYVAEAARLQTALATRRELVAEAERSLRAAEARCDAALAQRTAAEREVAALALR
jgi:chromosome segregation ATPase